MSDGTENLDRESGRAAISLAKVDQAAADLAGRFSGIFTGAPKTVAGVMESFKGLIPGVTLATKAVKGFEGYVGVLQALSRGGIHFNNQIDEMIIQAGAANMNLGDLARIAQESGEQIAQLGAGANAGLSNFLARQEKFYNEVDTGYEQRLKRLGMTVDDINESFLRYDMLSAVNNVTERQATLNRNKRATEFAEEMDRLAKLTGMQADELAKAVEETARKGRVFAATQLLPETGVNGEDIRARFTSDLAGVARAYGPAIGAFMEDMVTQGFPTPGDPAMEAINSYAPDLARTFETYNNLMKQGRSEEARGYLESARMQVERLRTDRNFLEMVRVSSSGASEHARAMGEISTQLNNSIAVSNSAIAARLREQGKAVTDEAIQAERNRLINEAQANQQRDAQSGSARVYQGYLDTLTELQQIARVTQEITVRTIFSYMEDAIQDFADKVAALDLGQLLINATTGASNTMTGMGLSRTGDSDARMFDQIATSLVTLSGQFTGSTQQSRDLRTELLNLSQEMSSLAGTIQTDQAGIATQAQKDRRAAASARINEILNSLSTLPEAERPQLSEDILALIREGAGLNRGTMGVTGSLFKDFGTETIAALHGLEAVTTPDQMRDIVANSAAGSMEALVASYNNNEANSVRAMLAPTIQSLTSNTSSLNGMLNTIRTQVASSNNDASVNIDLTPLENAIKSLPASMKQPFEEAINSIKPAMDQVAANTARGAEYGERTFRNTRGISQDYMRGA